LNDYDIVVLNEAFIHKDLLMSESFHKYRYIPPKPRLRVFGSGLLFLSKYPITKCTFERYTHTASVDSLVSKGIALCNISVVGEDGQDYGTLQVFGTHMQSDRTKAAQVARRDQARQAAQFIIKNRTVDGSPVVFVGDMNMGPRQDVSFSQHYFDEDDAEARCASYQSMVSECSFQEVQCEDPAYCNEICRLITQCVDDCKLDYVAMCNETGLRLSDTDAMCLSLTLKALMI
jgi:endonuclease/exonuclease/phosphatase family metal-dependent hydrolase